MNVLEIMRVGPVIPVIVIDDLAQAVPLAKGHLEKPDMKPAKWAKQGA